MEAIALLIVLLVLLGGYFLPGIIAIYREHHNRFAILALNFFLGWTLLGWVAALIWSLTQVQKDE